MLKILMEPKQDIRTQAASSVLYKILRPETPFVQRNVPLHVRSQRVGSLELDAPEEK